MTKLEIVYKLVAVGYHGSMWSCNQSPASAREILKRTPDKEYLFRNHVIRYKLLNKVTPKDNSIGLFVFKEKIDTNEKYFSANKYYLLRCYAFNVRQLTKEERLNFNVPPKGDYVCDWLVPIGIVKHF